MKYYLSISNNKVGPFTEKEILRSIKAGKVTLFDLIFNQQSNEWVMLMQHPDFSDVGEDADVELDQDEPVVGLLSETGFIAPKSPLKLLKEESPSLAPISWYLKTEKPAPLKFLTVLALVNSRQVTEQTLIAKSPEGPFKPVMEWDEFSAKSRDEFQKKTKAVLPEAPLRRKAARRTYGKNLLVLTREKVSKVFCLDVSKSGLSIVVRQDMFVPGEEVYVKFKEVLEDNKFDLKAKVISARKVKIAGHTEDFIRYGILFTHMTATGKQNVENLAA